MITEDVFILPGLEEYYQETKEIPLDQEITCLALTVQKKYAPIAIKNVISHSLRLTFKISISTFIATFLKLFI